jgi:hypothetical protein
MVSVTTWADLAALFSSPLSPDDIAGGWTDSLRMGWQHQALAFRDIGMRFLPSDAAPLLKAFRREGVTSGPIVEAMSAAKNGFGGVGTPGAVALAVKLLVVQTRVLGFVGRAPTLRRETPAATVHLVNFQRVVLGVTGREPGFTVNLNVVHGALLRAWEATGHWSGKPPLASRVNVGVATRLGFLTEGRDVWWHPGTDAEAEQVAGEVSAQLTTTGMNWLDHMTDPSTAIDELLRGEIRRDIDVAAALLAERPGDARRHTAVRVLTRSDPAPDTDERALRDWLLERL